MNRKISREEVNRKLLHLLALTMPVLIFYGPAVLNLPQWAPCVILSVLVVASVVTEGVRFSMPAAGTVFERLFGYMLRKNEVSHVTGSTYIICGAYLCCVLLKETPHIAFMTLTLFIIGDGAAALAGKRFGKVNIAGKTLEGSLACFGVCLAICFFVFPVLPLLLSDWGGRMPFSLAVATSLAITLLELFPLRLSRNITFNDNMIVPPLAGLMMQFLYPIMS